MIEGSKRTFIAGTGGVSEARLVKLSSGKAVLNTATDTDNPVGVAEYDSAENEACAVRLINGPGTFFMTAAGAISLGAEVYAAADGKVSALSAEASTYRRIGLALEAATADGDIIEVLPLPDAVHTEVSGT